MDELVFYQLWWLPNSTYGRYRPVNEHLYTTPDVPLSLLDKYPNTLFPNVSVFKLTITPYA